MDFVVPEVEFEVDGLVKSEEVGVFFEEGGEEVKDVVELVGVEG